MKNSSLFKEDAFGITAQIGDYDVFFSYGSTSDEDLQKQFPHITFRHLKQVHGCKLIEASEKILESDAHWSQKQNEGLIIKTADCLPVLVCHPKFICAIHAGWRGVMSNIIGRSLSSLATKFGDIEAAKIFIGPHIQQKSFQVDLKLAQDFQILVENYSLSESIFHVDPNQPEKKAFVDLAKIAKAQMRANKIQDRYIFPLDIDTVENHKFQSYRRGKSTAGRNLSFVARRNESH